MVKILFVAFNDVHNASSPFQMKVRGSYSHLLTLCLQIRNKKHGSININIKFYHFLSIYKLGFWNKL
jgi:hypothetical protein